MIKKGCQSHLDNIPGNPSLQEIQKIVLTSTAIYYEELYPFRTIVCVGKK